MEYYVARQKPWDGLPYVEIAHGLDELSPGCLVAEYSQEGSYDNRADAAQAAIELSEVWEPSEGRICISTAASIGMYPSEGDEWNVDELLEWIEREPGSDLDDSDD
jgi:hypothetical protein